MSSKIFRKISHPEPKILNSLVNCTHTDAHTDAHQDMSNLELTTRGGSAKKGFSMKWVDSDLRNEQAQPSSVKAQFRYSKKQGPLPLLSSN